MKTKSLNIEFSEDAEIDFDNSYQYYLKESVKVAEAFFRQINSSLRKIKKHPDLFPIVFKNIRKFNVRKFPFVIYYFTTIDSIRIIAIFHSSRNPQIWNQRN
jgi:plasmid stabilization system protein ParE